MKRNLVLLLTLVVGVASQDVLNLSPSSDIVFDYDSANRLAEPEKGGIRDSTYTDTLIPCY